MSGLSRFVERGQRAPTPPAGAQRLDLAVAQSLKFGAKQKYTEPTAAPPAQYLASTAPAPGYESNPNAFRNTYPREQFSKQQPLPYSKPFDEVTVNSDFDDTKTDLDYDLEDGNSEYGQEEEGMASSRQYGARNDQRYPREVPQHALHHVQRATLNLLHPENVQSPPKLQASGTHSRFKNVKTHQDLQLRQPQVSEAMEQQNGSARKRNRSDESRNNHEQHRHPRDEELEETDEFELPGPQSKERQNQFEISSDEAETPSASPSRQRKARIAHSSQLGMVDGLPLPDYTDEKLKAMKYSDLKAEDWDNYPNPKPFELPAKLRGKPLADQIAYYADRAKKNVDSEDVLFFEHLSTSEWEQAGDIIVDKFADLLKQLKEKRQEKRRITERFEAEIEAREKAVRGKSNLFDKKFKDMQISGQNVLKGGKMI
ncbi:Extracellular mutant protein 11 domain containing protein [Hyaloscypha variabilis]